MKTVLAIAFTILAPFAAKAADQKIAAIPTLAKECFELATESTTHSGNLISDSLAENVRFNRTGNILCVTSRSVQELPQGAVRGAEEAFAGNFTVDITDAGDNVIYKQSFTNFANSFELGHVVSVYGNDTLAMENATMGDDNPRTVILKMINQRRGLDKSLPVGQVWYGSHYFELMSK